MERIYIIKTNLTPEKNEEIISKLDERLIDRIKISNNNTINIDELGGDGYITSYLIGSKNDIDLINEISEKHDVKIEIHDITNEFMSGEVDIEYREFAEFRKTKLRNN